MRTYSGYGGLNNNQPQKPKMSKTPVYALMLVVGVISVLFIFNRGSIIPGIPSADDAIRFYYAVSGGEIEHIDITFTEGSVSGTLEALEKGFKEPPRGRDFSPAISSGINVNKVLSYENTVEIDFSTNSHPVDGVDIHTRAIAFTLLDLYNADRVYITVNGDIFMIIEQ